MSHPRSGRGGAPGTALAIQEGRLQGRSDPNVGIETDDAARERCELDLRELYVAMTRARSGLWVGAVRSRDTPALGATREACPLG